jgi:hypothetical protein
VKLEFKWTEYPIGFPLDPDDGDFESERTGPKCRLGITITEGDIVLRQAIMADGNRQDLSYVQEKEMHDKLTQWAKEQLEKLNET